MHRFFAPDMPALRFARNTLLASLATLLPLLVVFVASRPGFGAMLLDGGPALGLFLRQVVTNGLPVVFVVNWVGFVLHAREAARRGGRDAAWTIPTDMVTRLVLFALLHAAIYVLSARWFGSFGGSASTALGVVAPTLARAAFFDNVSGVYLYATLVSALPLYIAAVRRSRLLSSVALGFPGRSGPPLLALAAFGAFVALLTGAASWVAALQGA